MNIIRFTAARQGFFRPAGSARLHISPSYIYRGHTVLNGHHGRNLATTADISHPNVASKDLPEISMDGRKVSIRWDEKTQSTFHHIWLRDHCRCPRCFHDITKQRLVNTFKIPKDIQPRSTQASKEGLAMEWSDSHSVVYPWKWLREHTYDPPKQRKQDTEKVLWNSDTARSVPSLTYKDVMAEEGRGLYSWLSNIDKFGFGFVTGVPVSMQQTEELCTRIGFIRETQYGKFWEFTSDLTKGDTAYTNLALDAHTDNTYFTDPCGIQLFHLISHTDGSGGTTLLVDGFHVASVLKEIDPKSYEILSRVRIPAHAAGENDSLYTPSPAAGYPVLSHDSHGKLTQVRWNNDDRSVMSNLHTDEVEDWYEAIRAWDQLLTRSESQYWVQLTPGTVIAIDNHRVLHGRSSFHGKRHMCGAYIGVDEYRSKLAVLKERFEVSPSTMNGERSVWHHAL